MLGLRISRRGLMISVPLVLVAAAWSGWWWLASTLLDRSLESWVIAQRTQGSQIHFGGPQFDGFPWRVHATLHDVAITQPDGLTWHGPEVAIDAPLWRVNALHVHLVGHQEIRLPAGLEPAAISADGAEGWLTLGGIQGFTEARLILSGLDLAPASAARIELSASTPAGAVTAATDTGMMVTVAAERIQAPGVGSLALGPAIESLAATARVMGSPPRLEPASLSAWTRDGGTLELDTASLHWGPLALGAEGTLALDHDLQPTGTLTAEVAGFGAAIDALVAAGWVKPKNAQTAKAVLAGFAQQPEGAQREADPTAKIPISLHDRFIHVGPFRLAPLPPVVWQRPAAG